jgi:pyruvate formate lyase activating enzyme
MKCPYFHNPGLAKGLRESGFLDIKAFHDFLKKRKNVLGGVCISGGEPLLYSDLSDLVNLIHDHGLKVKIDTNASFSDRLEKLDVDYIAMDIKTGLANYSKVLSGHISENVYANLISNIKSSIEYIKHCGIDHEFRTTMIQDIVTQNDIEEIIPLVKGCEKYFLTKFRPNVTLDENYKYKTGYTIEELEQFQNMFLQAGIECFIRK